MDNQERAKYYKEKQQILTKEFEEGNPDYLPGKKLVFYSLVIVVVMMLINSFLGVAFRIKYNFSFTSNEVFVLVWPLVFSLVFARLIYTIGSKLFIILLLLGGIGSLYLAYINDVFLFLNTENMLLNAIGIFTIMGGLVQIFSMVLLLMNTKCKTYFRLKSDFNKKIADEMKILNERGKSPD